MKRFSMAISVGVLVAAMVLVIAGSAHPADAAGCNPSELSPCLSAIESSTPPSSTCCSKMEEQKPCLCGYFKNPGFKPYISGGKRVAEACGVSVSCEG